MGALRSLGFVQRLIALALLLLVFGPPMLLALTGRYGEFGWALRLAAVAGLLGLALFAYLASLRLRGRPLPDWLTKSRGPFKN